MDLKDLTSSIKSIDKNNLPEEWERHTSIYLQCAEQVSTARKEYEEAKQELELVEAELDRSIRLHPDRFRLEKITEKLVENTIKIQSSYKTAYIRLIETKHDKDVLELLLRACDHRKSALGDLVSLLIGGFYSQPKVKGEARQVMREIEKDQFRIGQDREE